MLQNQTPRVKFLLRVLARWREVTLIGGLPGEQDVLVHILERELDALAWHLSTAVGPEEMVASGPAVRDTTL